MHSLSLHLGSIPTKCLPNQGGHQDENDYIYYDRDVSDKSASIMIEESGDTKSSGISPGLKKDNTGYTHTTCDLSTESILIISLYNYKNIVHKRI